MNLRYTKKRYCIKFMVKKIFWVVLSSQKAEKSWKMTIFSVSPKISDSRNAKIIFLTVKYIRYMYRILFDGSKGTENREEKCENCLSQIFIGWIRNRAVVSHNLLKSKFWLFIFKNLQFFGIFRPPHTFSLDLGCI